MLQELVVESINGKPCSAGDVGTSTSGTCADDENTVCAYYSTCECASWGNGGGGGGGETPGTPGIVVPGHEDND